MSLPPYDPNDPPLFPAPEPVEGGRAASKCILQVLMGYTANPNEVERSQQLTYTSADYAADQEFLAAITEFAAALPESEQLTWLKLQPPTIFARHKAKMLALATENMDPQKYNFVRLDYIWL